MHQFIRTSSDNLDFQRLVRELDKHLLEKNGEENDFFAQYNRIDHLNHVVLVYDAQHLAIGCGALKEYAHGIMEIKRMFVEPNNRGFGIASKILDELETWAKELGCTKFILETGNQMIAAITLYKKHHFNIIPNYGQYRNVENSVCFEKHLDF